MAPSHQIQKVYPLQECVNFGYGISSKIPEVLGKIEIKILTHSLAFLQDRRPSLTGAIHYRLLTIHC